MADPVSSTTNRGAGAWPIYDAPTPEQAARNMLERMGVDDAQGYSAGSLVELANLIAEVNEHRRTNVEAVETITKLTAALEVLP